MKKPKTADMMDENHQGETPINRVGDALESAESRQAEREENEARIADADKEAIDSIITSNAFGKGGKIRVTRKGPLDQTYQYVCTIPADEWDTEQSIEFCRKMYGGGDYKCQTFRSNGSMYKPFTFSIDYRYKGKLDEQEIKQLATEGSKGPNADMVTKMFETMKQEQGMKTSDMIAMMKESSGNTMQMMTFMMTMMMKSMETSAQNSQTMMMALAQMFAGKQATGDDGTKALLLEMIKQKAEHSPMGETLDMMAKIKDIFSDDRKDEPEDMFSKIGKIAGPILSGMMGGQPRPSAPQVTVAPPAEPGRIEQPQAKVPESSPLGGMYAMLNPAQKMLFNMMFSAAERNSDPAPYADLITDQMSPEDFAAFRSILTAPDWCAKLFGNEASVAHIRPWLDELRSLLVVYGTESSSASESGGHPDTSGPKPA